MESLLGATWYISAKFSLYQFLVSSCSVLHELTDRQAGRQADAQTDGKQYQLRSAELTVACVLFKTINSSGDERANVNFLYDDIVHALENTIDSCINSATYRFLQRMFTKFSKITQCNGHYAVQGHSRSPIWVPIKSLYTTSY